ncbi:MAG: molybdopterin molybdotransferase MoeA [Desulfobacteraceae bacterium]|nr:molybdopterin molybdotransferase MoeA [Desulfobacteraceae bacterium]
MSKEFFTVTPIEQVFGLMADFAPVGTESIALQEACERILAEDIISGINIPGFARATMDGYAVRAASTFGASEASPAYLSVSGRIEMGATPCSKIGHGQAVRIATGGMLPEGADAVVMMEHASELDETSLEVYKSVAPGGNIVAENEDFSKGSKVLSAGTPIRPQEMGLLAAVGKSRVTVFKKPVTGIISTGDELVDIDHEPSPGKIRDVNTYSLSGRAAKAGAHPVAYGIIPDDYGRLLETCKHALGQADMILISGGSSVGTRDLTLDVIAALPESEILVHGIPVRPGKPTILAKAAGKAIWGLPGQIASAMVVFDRIVAPFIGHIAGNALFSERNYKIPAILTRNISSVQGRTEFVRTRIIKEKSSYYAEPVPGPAGLIRTMVEADGLIEIDINTEGLEKGERVEVIILR